MGGWEGGKGGRGKGGKGVRGRRDTHCATVVMLPVLLSPSVFFMLPTAQDPLSGLWGNVSFFFVHVHYLNVYVRYVRTLQRG